jgi:hypothetical protein
MMGGANILLATAKDPEAARRLLGDLDALYNDVRNGLDVGHVRGWILERYVWHRLVGKFPLRIQACEVLEDGIPISSYSLDAATCPDAPAVGIEAKSSEFALVGGGVTPKLQRKAKAQWVTGLYEATDRQILGVFVTWGNPNLFRRRLEDVVGEFAAAGAEIVAHTDVADLPARVEKLLKKCVVPTAV